MSMTTDSQDRIQVPGFFTVSLTSGKAISLAVSALHAIEEQNNATQINLVGGGSCIVNESREQVMRLIYKAQQNNA